AHGQLLPAETWSAATAPSRPEARELMMSQLGTYLLLFSLAVSGYGLLAAAVGAKTGRPALVESARRCAFALFATMAAASATMLVPLLTTPLPIRSVPHNPPPP